MDNIVGSHTFPRTGSADEIAMAIVFAIENEFGTGTIVELDAGATRDYTNTVFGESEALAVEGTRDTDTASPSSEFPKDSGFSRVSPEFAPGAGHISS